MNKISVLFFWISFISFYISSKKPFLFSVIIPIYNTGRFLQESLNSLYNQTIGFENIQVILINDGSLDESKKICLKNQRKNKRNIIYIEINHSGVGKARNIGLENAKGKYINFLDPDDTWDSRAFEFAYNFFKNNPNINVAAGRMKFFEAREGFHPLDYKFKNETHIANLLNDYDSIQLSVANCFFRYSKIKRQKFNEKIIQGEDTLFINSILLKKPLIGYLNEVIYNYRKRFDGTSTIQTARNEDSYYFDSTNFVYQFLIKLSNTIYNKTLPFIQYSIAYELLYRLIIPSYKILNLSKYLKYIHIIENLLNEIEDKYIYTQKYIKNVIKLLALSKKYKKDLRNDIVFEDGKFKYKHRNLLDPIKDKDIIIWKFVNIENNVLYLEGHDNCWLKREKYSYFCIFRNNTFLPKYKDYEYYGLNTLYGKIIKGRLIFFEIPLYNNLKYQSINFYMTYMGKTSEIFPSLGWFSHIPPIENGYYISNGYIILNQNYHLVIYKATEEYQKKFEKNYREELILEGKEYMIPLREKAIKNNKKKRNKEIWLIHDRSNQAGDNGEHFFRYLKKKNPKDIEAYFVIKDNCPDYERLKPLGDILPLNSSEYLEMFFKADKIISSLSNNWISNPFGKDRKYIYDLFHFDHAYIEHGILKDDSSEFNHRHLTNYSIFVTSSKREYKSILAPNYGYNKNIVKLTGLARYDNLEHLKKTIKPERLILIIPTWRRNIRGSVSPTTFESVYNELFKFTDYFKFYNSLINDNSLLESMKKYNYTGIFSLHPCFSSQWKDFTKNSMIKIISDFDYQKMFAKASLLITDYSSIFFDFAYLKKPIIFTQFDYEEFRTNQYEKGYFDYIKDGFGPICRDYETSINTIIKYLKNNCSLEKVYLKRIMAFFAFFDEHNNDRIYQAIKDIGHHYENDFSFFEIVINFILFFGITILFTIKIIISANSKVEEVEII